MPVAAFPEDGVGSLRNNHGKHWLRPWQEDEKKVVVMRARAGGTPAHPLDPCIRCYKWTHEPNEPVPMQLSGSRLDFELWQEFLSTLADTEPHVEYPICLVLPLIIFVICLVLAAALDTFLVLFIGSCVGSCIAFVASYRLHRRYTQFRHDILGLFQQRFEARGVTMSIEWGAETSHKIHRFFVLQPHAECLTNLVRITVPGNANPGDELKVQPAGRNVVFAAIVPQQAQPGDVFYAASPGPVIQPVEGVVVPEP